MQWLWKNLGLCIFPVAKVVIDAGLGEISGGGVICSVWMPLLPYAAQEDIGYNNLSFENKRHSRELFLG